MNFLDQIQQYWAIILFVGTVIASWVRYEAKLDAVKKELQETRIDCDDKLGPIRDRLRQVEIKAAGIDGISGDIKGINAKLDIILKKIQL